LIVSATSRVKRSAFSFAIATSSALRPGRSRVAWGSRRTRGHGDAQLSSALVTDGAKQSLLD
jgi:hypothetical protein